jgi:hypothetical protein
MYGMDGLLTTSAYYISWVWLADSSARSNTEERSEPMADIFAAPGGMLLAIILGTVLIEVFLWTAYVVLLGLRLGEIGRYFQRQIDATRAGLVDAEGASEACDAPLDTPALVA